MICRYIPRICCLIGNNQDFTWSCHSINADMTVNCFLSQCHIDVSRSYDLIYSFNTFRSVCQSSDCLCSACFIDHIHSCFMCCNQSGRRDFSVSSRGSSHDNLIHSCHFRRNHIHKHRGRISGFPARHIDTDSLKRRNFLSQNGSVAFAVKPAVLFLFLMIDPDISHGFPDNVHKAAVYLFISLPDFFFCDPDIVLIYLSMVKLLCIGKQGIVPLFFYTA